MTDCAQTPTEPAQRMRSLESTEPAQRMRSLEATEPVQRMRSLEATEPVQRMRSLEATEPQRLRALEHANAVRLARAELKRRIAEGELSAATVILECPDAVQRWTVAELLMSQRRWGVTRCRKFLERNGLSEIKTIGALTARQRDLLAQQLSQTGPGAERAAERDLVWA